jgi:hypothetical protein
LEAKTGDDMETTVKQWLKVKDYGFYGKGKTIKPMIRYGSVTMRDM